MTLMVLHPADADRLKAERRASGGDRYDEVWEGVYMMAPLANDEHQELQARLVTVIQSAVGLDSDVLVRAGVNVSDRDEGWEHNYRCPDVVVFLPTTSAVNRDTHWVGGPEFAAEIVSAYDRSRAKLDFYGDVRVREVLFVDRDPWALELYRHDGKVMASVGRSDLAGSTPLRSDTLGLTFRLVPGRKRPAVEVVQPSTGARWLA